MKADLIGQPEFAGESVVAVRRVAGEQLEIFGVDIETGKELWAHPLSPGAAPTGYEVGFEVVEAGDRHQVGFFAPRQTPVGTASDEWWTPIVVVDAESGGELYRSPRVRATEPLDDCEDEGGFCVRAYADGAHEARTWQVDVARRTLVPAPDVVPDGAREISDGGLYSTNDRPGERFGRSVGGRTAWEVPVEKAFGIPVSSDGGWQFGFVEEENVFVGLIGRPAPRTGPRPTSLDFAEQAGGALNGETGETLWAEPGVDPTCGPVEPGLVAGGGLVRCRLAGTVHFGGDEPRFEDLEVTVEGYDLVSGRTTWSHEVVGESAEALAFHGKAVVSSGGDVMVVDTREGRRLLATRTGELTPVTADDRFLCAEPVEFRYRLGWRAPDKTIHDRRGGSLHFPCDGELEPVTGPPSTSSLADGALWATETTYVLGTKDGLVGYRAP